MAEEKVKIAIAEDHTMVRQGFVRALSDLQNVQVVIEAKDGFELVKEVVLNPVDLIVLDIVMPGMDGKDVIEKVRAIFPNIKILVVSAQEDHNLISKYVKLGASGFIPKTGDVYELLRAVSEILLVGYYFPDEILDMLSKKGIYQIGGPKQLTALELKILRLLCEERSYAEIASELNIKSSQVSYTRTRILHKTNTSNVEELQTYAKSNLLM